MLGRDRAEASFTRVDEDEFYQFLDRDDSNYKILLPHEGSGHHEIESSFRSFLACPLKDKDSNIYGVIRLTRSFPGSVFTDDDLSLIRSVSNRLALSEINRLILIEREETLKKKLKIISKINSQINTSHGTEKCHLDNILRSILRAVTDMFGFEFATIQLVHHDQKTIATVDVMKNSAMPDALDPEQWKGATHPLDPPEGVKRDIHAWLLREHKEPCIIKGWDQHFDREIYTKYGHEKLIRAFVPIVTQNTQNEIGTLEAGYNIERRSFIDDEQIAMLKVLADQAAIAIRNYNQQRNLINAERLAERLQLMPDMAHILKSPAGQVSMLLTQIERELDQADSDGMLGTGRNKRRLRDYIDLAKRAVFTIETTSRTLYVEVASRIAPQKEERIEIVDALRRLINSYLYSGRIRFETTIQHGCPLLMTQSECTSLDVILLNLLDNAIKFSSPDNEVQVVCYKDDDGVCVSVTNRGLGISREDYRYIFEPGFHRLAPGWPEGTGMGLYTVKRLLDKLGWSCKVDPQMTGGARFVIRIPVGRRI
jgi:signal transduction histidine kinase